MLHPQLAKSWTQKVVTDPEALLGPMQASAMEIFATIVNG